ncbi:hypothetical protein DAEQUDRAFT_813588 [Daedalea quercina L-15889]|uniref:RNA polymerase II elongation factor ELL N-terminal domain-containing protein n=1 Tax=Daedalea quercina L-15889 TaxID=1314783 RepID=A0A165N0C6_9APHY|nr:hypothetical protein DAEQUDRAFT_813588 [Daedalea quercina L-15889]
MPLPGSTTLSLQGLPKPGDALYSKPKQAMIVRMTAEALEALEVGRGNAAMDFEFGDNPGIHIGDAFFPMTATPDNSHELYLRQTTAAKPNAPLKLYGHVSGKLMVNPELGKAVEDRVRDRTRIAEAQRTERKVIPLEGPLDLGKPTKRKKEPTSMFRKPAVSATDGARRNLSAASASQATRGASPRVSAAQANAQPARPASPAASTSRHVLESDPGVRGRLIHLLAAQPGAQEDVILKRVVGGQPSEAKRLSLLRLLGEVGMKSGDGGPRVWQLRPSLWTTDVRPYEHSFSSAQADVIVRNAVAVFKTLELPPNHRAWDNVRKPKDESRPGTPLSHHLLADDSSRPESRRPIVKETKSTKAKANDAPKKRKANDPIPMKDESVHAPSLSKGKERAAESPMPDMSTSSGRPSVMRRLPGSGYKSRASGTPPDLLDTPNVRAASPAVPTPPKRTGPVDARQSKRSMPPPSGSADPAPPIAPPAIQERRVSGGSTATKPAAQRKTDDDRSASHTLATRKAARDPERGRDLSAGASSTRKFKKRPVDDDDDYSDRDARKKKRKIAETKAAPDRKRERERDRERDRERERESDRDTYRGREKDSDLERGRGRARDAPIPKKAVKQEASPITVARVKVKKESSPAASFMRSGNDRDTHTRPPSRLSEVETARTPSSSSSVSRADPQRSPTHSHSRSRRKSPVYTSSEDESPPSAKVKVEITHKDRLPKLSKPKYVPLFKQRSAPLPSDAEALMKYYRKCYRVYTELYSQKTKFVMKYQDVVQDGEDEYVYISDSDSDSPLELFDPDITAAFTADLTAVEEELRKIRMTYENMEISGDSD